MRRVRFFLCSGAESAGQWPSERFLRCHLCVLFTCSVHRSVFKRDKDVKTEVPVFLPSLLHTFGNRSSFVYQSACHKSKIFPAAARETASFNIRGFSPRHQCLAVSMEEVWRLLSCIQLYPSLSLNMVWVKKRLISFLLQIIIFQALIKADPLGVFPGFPILMQHIILIVISGICCQNRNVFF